MSNSTNTTKLAVSVLYFASLAETADKDEELIQTARTHLGDIYEDLKIKYGFELEQSQLAVAINHQIANWQTPIAQGDIIAFIPPVAGG